MPPCHQSPCLDPLVSNPSVPPVTCGETPLMVAGCWLLVAGCTLISPHLVSSRPSPPQSKSTQPTRPKSVSLHHGQSRYVPNELSMTASVVALMCVGEEWLVKAVSRGGRLSMFPSLFPPPSSLAERPPPPEPHEPHEPHEPMSMSRWRPLMESFVCPLLVAVLRGDSSVSGTVTFEQSSESAPTTISYCITGNDPDAQRGMHVHQFGDNTNGCTSAGPHCEHLSLLSESLSLSSPNLSLSLSFSLFLSLSRSIHSIPRATRKDKDIEAIHHRIQLIPFPKPMVPPPTPSVMSATSAILKRTPKAMPRAPSRTNRSS